MIVELDPALIDNSFVPDRMEATEEQNASFRDLIRQHGQNVPILVRPNPSNGERYEVAFGHRRLRAARELGIRVRAVVRSLTDEELVVAQGQENSGRTDLTFIERARFAARLEDRKFSREVIMSALNVDKAALSRLIAVATRIPPAVIDAIGPAPSFGRVRWQELTELVDEEGNRSRSLDIVKGPTFAALDTDKRFETLTTSAAGQAAACTTGSLGFRRRDTRSQSLPLRKEVDPDVRRPRRTAIWRLCQGAAADALRSIQSRKYVGLTKFLDPECSGLR